MTEQGTLPFGIERDGIRRTSFGVREQIFRDSFDLLQEKPDLEKASDAEFGLHLLAKRLTVQGVPSEEITPDLILDLCSEDYNAVQEAVKRLELRRVSFRGAAEAAAEAGDNAA